MRKSFNRQISRTRTFSHRESPFFNKENTTPDFFHASSSVPFFNTNTLQRKCDSCEQEDQKKDKNLQRKESHATIPDAAFSASAHAGPASSLPVETNRFFSRALGQDFSKVTIHSGTQADKAAKSISAKAYTLGNQIVFANGQYQPQTFEGKKLLAHELTHVMQQGKGISRKADPDPVPEAREEAVLGNVSTSGSGSPVAPVSVYANCAGAQVEGRTDADYQQSTYEVSGATVKQAKNCVGCDASDCVTVSGIIQANYIVTTNVTLPDVPPGQWSVCERTAIQNFINTTLSNHEQQHVAAFHTFDGQANTPFTYTGCRDGWEGHVAAIYNAAHKIRADKATAKSKKLDANGANLFTITCDCPEPVKTPAPEQD